MRSILLVDDCPNDLVVAQTILHRIPDIEIMTASTARDALALLQEHRSLLVITDVHMPQMDGLELLRVIRNEYPLSPVIVMTGHGSEAIAAQALNDGAAGYVPKRALEQQLGPIVDKVLRSAVARRESQRLEEVLAYTETRFILDNDVSLIPPIVGYLQEKIGRLLDPGENELLRIGIAIHEALTNAVLHGNLEVSSDLKAGDDGAFAQLANARRLQAPFAMRKIHVTGRVSLDEFVCIIRDEGPGFSPEAIPDPLAPENLERPSGRGLLMIRKFMDAIEHNQQGNEIVMRHNGRRVED